jgi:hypothetical protein
MHDIHVTPLCYVSAALKKSAGSSGRCISCGPEADQPGAQIPTRLTSFVGSTGYREPVLVKVQVTRAEQADKTDNYQIQRHNVVQQLRGHQNQNARDQRRQGTNG